MKTEQIERIYKEYPKATLHLEEWLLAKMREVPEGMTQFDALKGDFEKKRTYTTKFYLQMGPRFLYEFFDERGLYVTVKSKNNKGGFYWSVDISEDKQEMTEGLQTNFNRAEAEHAAFEAAFKILEGKL